MNNCFFTDPILNQPAPPSLDISVRNSLVLKPIDNVASTSGECSKEVEEYEESNNVIKTVNEKLQKCILKSQCKFIKISQFPYKERYLGLGT